MAQLAEHPTVKRFQEREAAGNLPPRPQTLDRDWLRQVCLDAGAADAGFVEIHT
jgi:epoxyqueuosine reductase